MSINYDKEKLARFERKNYEKQGGLCAMQLFKWRNQKRKTVGEKRRAPRIEASDIPNLRIICDGGGPEAELVNISRHGALIESREYMSPGTSMYLQLAIGENLHFVRGRIIGHRDSSTSGETFKIAVAFDEEFTSLPLSGNLREDEGVLE